MGWGVGGGILLKAVEEAWNVSPHENSQAFIKEHQGAWYDRELC